MVKKILHKIQAISLVIALVLLWIPWWLTHNQFMMIASAIILLNAIAEWF